MPKHVKIAVAGSLTTLLAGVLMAGAGIHRDLQKARTEVATPLKWSASQIEEYDYQHTRNGFANAAAATAAAAALAPKL